MEEMNHTAVATATRTAKITKEGKAAKAAPRANKANDAVEAKPIKKQPVRIKLFKDNDRYKSDVFVSVNGRNYQIRRGVEMEVPAEVAEVLAHSETQDEITARRIEQAAEKAMQ